MFMFALPPRVATLIRIIGLILIDWSVFSSGHPPGGSGRGLVVSILVVLATGAWLAWLVRAARERRAVRTRSEPLPVELYVLAASGGLLTVASPGSAASAFVFVAVVAAALRAELLQAAVVVAIGLLALAVGTVLYSTSGLGLVAYGLGLCAAALAGSNSRQSAVRAEQAELLLAQAQRSHEEQLRSARLEESTRIARDIHDVLAHTLAGLAIQLEATAALLEQDADRTSILGRVRRAHELAIEGLRETRRAVGALRDGATISTADGLRSLVEEYEASMGATAELSIAGDCDRLTGSVGQALLRITQEALTNVRKHAPGADVHVELDAGSAPGDGVALAVSNRSLGAAGATGGATGGASFGRLAPTGGGFGVAGMRERAEELGGSLTAGPVNGGWRVKVELPAVALGGRP